MTIQTLSRKDILNVKGMKRFRLICVTDFTELGGSKRSYELIAQVQRNASTIFVKTEPKIFPDHIEQHYASSITYEYPTNLPTSIFGEHEQALTEDGWFINDEGVYSYGLAKL